jgi:hypothetical protein
MKSGLESSPAIVSRIREMLDEVAAAGDEASLELATRRLAALGRDLSERLAMAAPALRLASTADDRREMVHRIRAIVD